MTVSKATRRDLSRKLARWALGHDERREFANLVSNHRIAAAEQEAASDFILLRAELLVRQQHPELVHHQSPPSAWTGAPLDAFKRWVETLQAQFAEELSTLSIEADESRQLVLRFSRHLGFRSAPDLIAALGLDLPAPYGAANEL